MDSANVKDCNDILPDSIHSNNIDYGHREIEGQELPKPHLAGCSSSPCRNDGHCMPLSPTEYKCNCINGYTGDECEIAPNLCDYHKPCQNGGSCEGDTIKYKCDCLLGFTGTNCEQRE